VDPIIYIVATGIVVAIGLIVGFIITKNKAANVIKEAQTEANRIRQDADKIAESKKKEAILEAKEEMHKLRSDFEKESRDRRNEIQRLERRNLQREESIDKKVEMLEKRDETLNKRQMQIEETAASVQELYVKQREELQRLSGLSSEEAKQILLEEISKEIKLETAMMIKDIEAKAKEEADKKSREIITCAIQRCAADHVAETTVHVVALPNDEMKGRIIGREGRNIRTLETLTGVDLIIDDTPEAVILSGFDPIRREVARIALEKLIVDGRIHPARIEEMVEKAKKEVENNIK